MYKMVNNGRYQYYKDVEYPEKHLTWPNFKYPSIGFRLSYCQHCGAYLDSYVTGLPIDEKLSEKGICSVCGFDHSSLPVFEKPELPKDTTWGKILDNCFSFEVNCNDFFCWACADSYNLSEEYWPLAFQLYDLFGYNGIYGLICWLKGLLPMNEILATDKCVIQVLLYLRKLTGVTFNPYTRCKLTRQILYNKIEYNDFEEYELNEGIKRGWISETLVNTLLNSRRQYKQKRMEILSILKERNNGK